MRYTGWCQNDFDFQGYSGRASARSAVSLGSRSMSYSEMFASAFGRSVVLLKQVTSSFIPPTCEFGPRVSKTPSWPRSWANFSPL